MSRPRGIVIALLAAGLAGHPAVLSAQVSGTEQALIQHLDTLLPILAEAKVARDRASATRDSTLREAPGAKLDTIQVGPLRVVAFSDQAAMAQEIVGAVWAEWGDAVQRSEALENTTFFFNWSTRDRPKLLDHPLVTEISAPRYMPRGFLEDNARAAIWGVIQERDLTWTRVGRWAGSIRPVRKPEWAYRELATTPSEVTRLCARGQGHACLLAMGLRLPEDPLSAWYTPQERMRVVLADHDDWFRDWAYYERWYPETAALLERCRSEGPGGNVAACDEILGGKAARSPLVAGRQYLAWLAIEAGGPGAYDRLVADSTMSPEGALTAASGLPLDALADRWLVWVEDNRPVVYGGLGTLRWVALFWFLVAGLLALRSTRWRLG